MQFLTPLILTIPFSFAHAEPPTPNAIVTLVHDNPISAAVTVIVIAAIVAVVAIVALCRKTGPGAPARQGDDDFRHRVAKTVLSCAIWGTVIVAALCGGS
jgi:uncharacterized membrane protein